MGSVFLGIFIIIILLFLIVMILRVVNYFLKSGKPDQIQEKKNAKKQITLEERLESLRELAGGIGPDSRYRRLDQSDLKLPNTIARRAEVYESVNNSSFLILPTSYVLTRSAKEAAPLLKMVSTLDADDPHENRIIFKFTAAPNLLPYHMAYLQSAIEKYVRTQSTASTDSKDTDIYLPTDLSETPEVIWENAFTHLDSFSTEGKFLIVWIEAKSVSEAAAAAKLLQPDPTHQGLHGKVRFPLDEKQTVQSSILVNLDNAVGEAISIEKDKKKQSVSILNRTESPLQIQHLMILNGDYSEPEIRKMNPPELISPGRNYSMKISKPESKIFADYQVLVSQEKDLSELRVDVGELNLVLAIDTDIQPHETFQLGSGLEAEPLSVIHIVVESNKIGRKKVILTPQKENGSIFSRETIPVIVPLDRYLEPRKRLLRYKVTFQFKNETQLTSDSLQHNYTDTRLTIRRQTLHKLLRSGKNAVNN